MAPTDRPDADGNTNGNGSPSPAALDPEQVAGVMVQQLTDMLAGWEHQALALAERGVDPRPLLAALAANLHTVADQLVATPDGPA